MNLRAGIRVRAPVVKVAAAAFLALSGAAVAVAIMSNGNDHAPESTSTTYREQGVRLGAPTAQAPAELARSGLRTASAAVAAVKRSRAFGGLFSSGQPVASLHRVTERYPITAGVSANVSYEAWVVTARGAPHSFGGSPPPAGALCTNVAIYDLEIGKWTEAVQSC